jgi:signal transduction histidine kinase/ActR/RegA family two-component response regulator
MNSAQNTKPAVENSDDNARIIALAALRLQRNLFPYAVGAVSVGLAIYLLAGTWSPSPAALFASIAIILVDVLLLAWAKKLLDSDRFSLAHQQLIHLGCGLCWSFAVFQMSIFAILSGPAEESLLFLAVGASVLCFLFCSPSILMVLIVGPLASAGPIFFLITRPGHQGADSGSWGVIALSFAVSLLLNRMIETYLKMWIERENLLSDLAGALSRAESMTRLKSGIVSTLGHDMRTGLQSVIQVLGAATGKMGKAVTSREHLASAYEATRDLLGVLDATLDAERADTGSLKVKSEPFDLVGLVRNVIDSFKVQAGAKGLLLSLQIDPTLDADHSGSAVGDNFRTRQILLNLIGNAIKYTQRGQVEVRITQDAKTISVDIADSGPGLSPEETTTAFEPFSRIERTSAGVPGAGLGLPLAREIASLMQGKIEVTSALGVGSCFSLILPFNPSLTCHPEATILPVVEVRERAMKVLIASDQPLTMTQLRASFELLGHSVLQSSSGQRAVDLLQRWDLDLVVLDCALRDLPGALGPQAVRALSGAAGNLPLIIFAGINEDNTSECLEAGADVILRQPATSADVARSIQLARDASRTRPSVTMAA